MSADFTWVQMQAGRVTEAVKLAVHRGAWDQAIKLANRNTACLHDIHAARAEHLRNSQRSVEVLPAFAKDSAAAAY